MKRPGRPPTTGRFATRAELLERVWALQRNLSDAKVAKSVGVSQVCVAKIIRSGEGRPA